MGCKVPLIRLDFPLPETPVTHMNLPNGNSAVTFLRLFPFAPFNKILLPFPERLTAGISILARPFQISGGKCIGFQHFFWCSGKDDIAP